MHLWLCFVNQSSFRFPVKVDVVVEVNVSVDVFNFVCG